MQHIGISINKHFFAVVCRISVSLKFENDTPGFLPRDAMQTQPMPSCSVCLYVRLSVCRFVSFVDSVKKSNRIFKIFSPSGSYTLLVFAHQTPRQYSDGNPLPKEGALNAGDVGKTSDSRPVYGFIACCQRCDCQFLLTRRASGPWKVDTYR